MSKLAHVLFLIRKKDSQTGYFLTFLISWIVIATFLTLNAQAAGAGPTLPYMKDWPIWLVYIIDVALVCWPIPIILDLPLAFGFVASWLLFGLVAVPSDLLRSWLQPYVGDWIVTPWPDIAIESLLVIVSCLIFLPIQSEFNKLFERILERKKE